MHVDAGEGSRPACVLFCDGLSTLAALVGDARIDGAAAGTTRLGADVDASFGGGAIGGARGGADRQWTAFMHYIVQLGQARVPMLCRKQSRLSHDRQDLRLTS